MDDPSFYDKLARLKQRVGEGIPDNILEYFLKKSKGDINQCITLLNENWLPSSSHVPDSIPPERSVYLSQSQYPNMDVSRPHPHHYSSRPDQSTRRPNMGGAMYTGAPPSHFGSHGYNPPPDTRGSSSHNEPFAYSRSNNSFVPLEDARVPERMPVSVPYMGGAVGGAGGTSHGIGNGLRDPHYNSPRPSRSLNNTRYSFEENTLKAQKDQLQRIKDEHELLLKRYARARNELKDKQQQLETIKRQPSQTVSDDELYMAECIQNSLRYDISKEKEKKKKIPVPKDHISKGSNNWSCPNCQWSNSPNVTICDKCSYRLP